MAENALEPSSKPNDFWRQFPWWFVAAIALLGAIFVFIISNPDYTEALQFISDGLSLTLIITFASLIPALLVGILVGLAATSKYALLRNPAMFYLSIVGGIPTIIMIFLFAWVIIPRYMAWFGMDNTSVTNVVRGVLGLSFAYSAIFGEAFRLGALRGSDKQAENHSGQIGTKIVIPAGFTFIALLRDSSLLSMLAVKEITQLSRLFAGSTFKFNEAYVSTLFLYLLLTIPLRFLLQLYEQWLAKGEAGPPMASG